MAGGGRLAGVIFDLDGTLVDSVPMSLAIINAMLAERGAARHIAYGEALPFASLGGLALVSGLMGADTADAERDLALFRERYLATRTPPHSIYPGVREMLAALRAEGLVLGVCSNKPQHLCEKVLGELGLAEDFAAVVGSAPDLPPKPAPDMLDRVLHKLGLRPPDCVVVGDSEVDIALARSRAMDCLFVEYGYGKSTADIPTEHRFAEAGALARFILTQARFRCDAHQAALARVSGSQRPGD